MGNVIAWKKDVFSMVYQEKIEYDEMASYLKQTHLEHGKAGQICHLKHLVTGKDIIVANAHFVHWWEYDFVRYAEAFWSMKQL